MSLFDSLRGRVLVVQAHPDDEVFATGAATQAAKSAGLGVHLRVFTGGEGAGVSGGELVEARRRKSAALDRSAALLGIDDWAPLAEPGRWLDTPDRPERTIAAAPVETLVDAFADALAELRPAVVLTVGPDGLTGHPDHVACHRAVAAAVARPNVPKPSDVFGAVLDRNAVVAGTHAAASTLGRPVGSGRVRGIEPGPDVVALHGPEDAAQRRREALDCYVPGLGTAPACALTEAQGAGDSMLLRFVLDLTGWGVDRLVRIAPTRD